MKTYTISVKYYIPAEDEAALNMKLETTGITQSEYYGSYEVVDEEESQDYEQV